MVVWVLGAVVLVVELVLVFAVPVLLLVLPLPRQPTCVVISKKVSRLRYEAFVVVVVLLLLLRKPHISILILF